MSIATIDSGPESPNPREWRVHKCNDYLEGVRRRPGMYVGPTDDRGMHVCVFELICFLIEQHAPDCGSRIEVILRDSGACSVRDDGPGLPVEVDPCYGIPIAEAMFTQPCFKPRIGTFSSLPQYLHGVGAACVSALSLWMHVEIRRDHNVYDLECERGLATRKLRVIAESVESAETGTHITFLPDPSIFAVTTEFNFERLAEGLEDLAAVYPGFEVKLTDERSGKCRSETYIAPRGMADVAISLRGESRTLHEAPVVCTSNFSVSTIAHSGAKHEITTKVQIAFFLLEKPEGRLRSFANFRRTPLHGTHVEGFRDGLVNVFRYFASQQLDAGRISNERLAGKLLQKVTAAIAIWHPLNSYAGATRDKLSTLDVREFVCSTVTAGLMQALCGNSRVFLDNSGLVDAWRNAVDVS